MEHNKAYQWMCIAFWINWACAGVLALVVIHGSIAVGAETRPADDSYQADLFGGRRVARIQIQIPATGLRQLAMDNWRQRPTALGTVIEGDRTYTNVEIHIKGGAGSYRPIDNNPALTLDFSKHSAGQTFHGLKKISLNNSVQDPSYLNEKICRELFNEAGSPAPRAGFTMVRLNGRSLGVHVLTEGFNKQFLHRYFENVHGNLYQTHGNQEINDRLDVNSGDDPKNDVGLKALARAVRQADSTNRWHELQKTLDVDRFLTFMALEIMLCHWDGYCMNQNNYRVFHDLGTNRMVFIAHGMDQMFGTGTMLLGGDKSSVECPIFPEWHGAVANAVMSTAEGRRGYLQRLGNLCTNLFQVEKLSKRVDELAAVLGKAMNEEGLRSARDYQRRVDALKEHIKERHKSLMRQLAEAERPLDPSLAKPVPLTGWATKVQGGQPGFSKAHESSRPNLLHISANRGACAGSWRTRLRLAPGRYRFEGELRLEGVKGGEGDEGAFLRISGRRSSQVLTGTADWQPVAYEFQLVGGAEVEFVCEFRSAAGQVWFDADKTTVRRIN